jgi:hypothetical protein
MAIVIKETQMLPSIQTLNSNVDNAPQVSPDSSLSEVDAAFPIKNPFRQLVCDVAHSSRWIVAVGQSDYIFRRRLLRIRASIARLHD